MIELEKYIDLSIGKINTSNCIKTLKDLERNRRTNTLIMIREYLEDYCIKKEITPLEFNLAINSIVLHELCITKIVSETIKQSKKYQRELNKRINQSIDIINELKDGTIIIDGFENKNIQDYNDFFYVFGKNEQSYKPYEPNIIERSISISFPNNCSSLPLCSVRSKQLIIMPQQRKEFKLVHSDKDLVTSNRNCSSIVNFVLKSPNGIRTYTTMSDNHT